MATRLYFPRDPGFTASPDAFTPTPVGTWTNDTEVVYPLLPASMASDDGSYLSRFVASGAVSGTTCFAIFVSPPLSAAYDWTGVTMTWTIRCQEEFSTQNVFQQSYWGFKANDGTDINLTASLDKGLTEWSTSLVSRTRTSADTISYTNAPGDRVFVEVGWDKDAAISGDIRMQFGYIASAGDLVGDGDAGIQNGWVEFSNNVVFDAEGTTYGDVPSRLMLGLL
jgi:hypothetical protein